MSRISTIKTSVSAAVSSAAIFLLSVPVYAAMGPTKPDPLGALKQAGEQSGFQTEGTELPVLIGNIIGGFLALLGAVFVVLMIYAGYLWMTAAGNEEQVTKAKTMIRNSVIGIVVIFLAYAITSFVVDSLLTSTGVVEE